MEVEINMVGVLAAAAASMVVGSLWYSKAVFGKTWMSLTKMDEKKMREGGWMPMFIAVVTSLLTAYVLAHVAYLSYQFFGNSFMNAAMSTAFWLWLGVAATTLVVHGAFEQRSRKLTVLNVGNQLVAFLAMGAAIGWVGL
ncbi:MAG: DUF1761 domain-containing protein [Candidatus Saccharimonadales bacterium]